MNTKYRFFLMSTIGLFLIQLYPTYALNKIEIIRYCKRSKSQVMCLREFDVLNKSGTTTRSTESGPIPIRVEPYRG